MTKPTNKPNVAFQLKNWSECVYQDIVSLVCSFAVKYNAIFTCITRAHQQIHTAIQQ